MNPLLTTQKAKRALQNTKPTLETSSPIRNASERHDRSVSNFRLDVVWTFLRPQKIRASAIQPSGGATIRDNQVELVLRILGALMLFAAATKAHELISRPVLHQGLWSNHFLTILQIEIEILLGLWLYSNALRRTAWLVTTLCFIVFAATNLYRAMSGANSCGCFGQVRVSPWVALTVIDLPAIVMLLVYRPIGVFWDIRRFLRKLFLETHRTERVSVTDVGPRLVSMIRLVPSIVTEPSFRRAALTTLLVISITTPILGFVKLPRVNSAIEVLEPTRWVGETLPILEHVDIATEISTGRWLVLFFRHDCHDCHQVMPEYRRLAERVLASTTSPRIAMIEVPPFGADNQLEGIVCSHGRLSGSKAWHVKTPVALTLLDGQVVNVFGDGRIDMADLVFDDMQTKEEGT